MNGTTKTAYTEGPPSERETLQAILRKLTDLDGRFDEFARVLLNAKFPYGKPCDHWRRP